MITIWLNGEKKEIAENIILNEFIQMLAYPSGTYAVAVNETFVPRSEYIKKTLQAGDRVEIVMPMQGG